MAKRKSRNHLRKMSHKAERGLRRGGAGRGRRGRSKTSRKASRRSRK